MLVLTALSFIGGVLAFVLITLSIASGLYYVSEFVEEHASFSKRCIRQAVFVVCGILVLSLFDGLPWYLVLLSLGSHAVYFKNLDTFPVIELTSGRFISACVLVFVNHFCWFRAFGQMQQDRKQVSFGQVASFFGICVWLVPFALFVSLSAGDNMLPSMTSAPTTPSAASHERTGFEFSRSKNRAGGLVKNTFSWVGEKVQPVLQTLGIKKGDDELLASHRRYA